MIMQEKWILARQNDKLAISADEQKIAGDRCDTDLSHLLFGFLLRIKED